MTPRLGGGLLMVGFWAMDLFFRKGETARSFRSTPTDRGSSRLIVLAYVVCAVALCTHVLPVIEMHRKAAWVGLGVGAAGFALRVWAMRVLGPFYTRRLLTKPDQRVVERGPYRFVRHPGYLGSLLIWTGAVASSANAMALVVVAAFLAAAYGYRIRTEEQMLVEALGTRYEEYRRRTWRLVPFVF